MISPIGRGLKGGSTTSAAAVVPWTAAGAGEAVVVAEGRATGEAAAVAAPGVEVLTRGGEVLCTRG